jgi:prepilin-type processing-associated H-X9-DG protein
VDENTVVRWTHELHRFKGNLLFADGHVEQVNTPGLAVTTAKDSMLPADLFVPSAQPTPPTPSLVSASGGSPAQSPGEVVSAQGAPRRTGMSVPLGSNPPVVAISANTPIGITVSTPIPPESPPRPVPEPKVNAPPAPVRPPARKAAPFAPPSPPEAAAPATTAAVAPPVPPLSYLWLWLLLLLLLLTMTIAYLIHRRVRASRVRQRQTAEDESPWLYPGAKGYDQEEDTHR